MSEFKKCSTPKCNYSRHKDIKNNGGLYCCLFCKQSKSHGSLCQKQVHSTDAIQLNEKIYIENWYGRLGNNIIQLHNAILTGLYYNKDIVIKPHYFFRNTKNIVIESNSKNQHGVTNLTNYFYRSQLNSKIFSMNNELALKILRDCFIIKGDTLTPLNDDEVVIHIRSGDIFKNDINIEYYQPPLSWYIRLITEKNFSKIYLISENRANPCLNKLLSLFPEKIFYNDNNKLDDDIKLLLAAKHVISSNGTFVPQLLLFSSYIQNVYTYENKDYARLMFPWKNSSIQHKIMLTFDETKPNNGL
jgi:hypothetical protein